MLKELRKKAGLTQNDLSERLNVKQSTISMWEAGKAQPTLSKILALASALSVNESDIIACFISNELKATCENSLSECEQW